MARYYFAYTDHMSAAVVSAMRPGIEPIGPAYLRDHRLAFTQPGKRHGVGLAHAQPAPGMCLWGGLYRITQQCQLALDMRVGNGVVYIRTPVVVFLADNTPVNAITYRVIQASMPETAPDETYLDHIKTGARDFNLPDAYLSFIDYISQERYKSNFRAGVMLIPGPAMGLRLHPLDSPSGYAGGTVLVSHMHHTVQTALEIDPHVIPGTCHLPQALRVALHLPPCDFGFNLRLDRY